jgi:excisionase family DNA binding protein
MLRIKEAAELLKISAGTLYFLCASKQIRHVRIRARAGAGRGSIRIPMDAIQEYLDRHTVAVVSPSPVPQRARPLKYLNLD